MSAAAQRTFMQTGGVYAGILQQKYDSGELTPPEKYVHQEYPKMLRLSRGVVRVTKSTERIRGRDVVVQDWEEDEEQFEDVTVNSEEEEMRVLHGGKSNEQIEAERQDMIAECKRRGLHVDSSWTYMQLQRQLGSAPSIAEVDGLRQRVAELEEMAALKERIAQLEAQVGARPADDAEALRAELAELGVRVDGRWSVARMREELEKATAP